MYSAVVVTYATHLDIEWGRIFVYPVIGLRPPSKGGVSKLRPFRFMNGLRSPLNGGVSKLKPYLFCHPRQMGAAAPRTPGRGLVRVFRAILYIYYVISRGGSRPPELSGRGLLRVF